MMLTTADVQALVDRWAERLHVQVKRVQIRTMRTKWGSISTAGVLTLADDILTLPPDLAEYIVVHELMHLRFPDHRRGWRVSMGMYLPDWRELDAQLRCKLRSARCA
jgi:predicted metal-dependent hydrolase